MRRLAITLIGASVLGLVVSIAYVSAVPRGASGNTPVELARHYRHHGHRHCRSYRTYYRVPHRHRVYYYPGYSHRYRHHGSVYGPRYYGSWGWHSAAPRVSYRHGYYY
jgi:hypothetical protein